MTVTIDYAAFHQLICEASQAKGYLGASNSDVAQDISRSLGDALEAVLDKTKYATNLSK